MAARHIKGEFGLPVRRHREGGGGEDQPPPSKTSKPTTQTTCWRLVSVSGAQTKAPPEGAGLSLRGLSDGACRRFQRAESISGKPTDLTRQTHHRLHAALARKSPAEAGLSSFRGFAPVAGKQTHECNSTVGCTVQCVRGTPHEKSPAETGLSDQTTNQSE